MLQRDINRAKLSSSVNLLQIFSDPCLGSFDEPSRASAGGLVIQSWPESGQHCHHVGAG